MTTWFITGCSTGLGRQLAKATLKRGFNVVVTARDISKVQDIAADYPGSALCLPLDVTDPEQIAQAVQQAENHFGSIDVLVNNAGYGYRGAIEETDATELKNLFEANFFGTVGMIQAVLPAMRARRAGTIVNVSSLSGRRSRAGSGAYSATKYAVEGMSEALRREVGPLGIRVILIEPGAFRTDFSGRSLLQSQNRIADYDATSGQRRKGNDTGPGRQLGDPARGAQAIIIVVEAPQPPFRLLLGSDAIATVTAELDAQRQELEAWKVVSISTDFPQGS